MYDSEAPKKLEPFAEDHALVIRKLFNNSQRIQRASEACELLPDTVEGAEAVWNIAALVDELHRTTYSNVEPLFDRIRAILQIMGVTIDL